MPEDCTGQPEDSNAAKAILEKPLQQLTEDDIAQLTREDCRRYLKEKGMRRPSWNKSQAIQQVIMLKSLLETAPESDAGSSKRLRISCTANSNSDKSPAPESVPTGTAEDAEDSISAEEMTQHSQKGVEKPDSSAAFPPCFPAANEECDVPRTAGSSKISVDQMTIFYGGKVNVYDNIPVAKAQTIMNIAAAPLLFTEEQPIVNTALQNTAACMSKAVSPKARPDSAAVASSLPKLVKMKNNSSEVGEGNGEPCQEISGMEGPSSRQASLQRYLEKKKERFKSKRKVGQPSSTSINNSSPLFCDDISRSETYPPPQITPPPTPAFCSSVSDTEMNISRPQGSIY